jgi:hypothetical protein
VYGWFLLHIIFHEAGHLVFGLLSGYGFSSFRVFNVMLLKAEDKFVLKRHSIPGTAGQCLMTPPELVDGKMPYLWYNLGGCIMNLAVSLGLLILNGMVPNALWIVGAAVGFLVAVTNGIPMNVGGVCNDGYNALSLGKNPAALGSFWVQLKVTQALSQGMRLKDMPEQWFTVPADAEMKNPMTAVMGYLACLFFLDGHRFDEAKVLMEHYLQTDNGLLPMYKDLLACERIFCELIGDKDPAVIDEYLTDQRKKTMKAMKTNLTVIRTEYALALLRDQNADAADRWRKTFEKQAKVHSYPCEVEAERELLTLMREKHTII